MAKLFPSRGKPSVDRDGEPSVLYVDSDEAAEVITTLSGETAMAVFRALTHQALTASELAEELDASVQKVSYHLENLEAAGLVEVVDTCYSEKGREMDIYAVANRPTVLVLGSREDRVSLRQAFGQLAGAVGISAVGIAAWQSLSGALDALLEV
ncbi:ArsR family transcriptional regulator [Halobacteriales archaeon SW_10_68_16]|jgi:predicted ArsR family transcriptional regulator|nr:MAG: ArsR family transcriptional regulator [Halobacteriales archaeon SW_10_68_16]